MALPLVLPSAPVPALTLNPQHMFLYSKPKVGKTELLAQLPDSLLIDLEKGTNFVSALKMQANNIDELQNIFKLILRAGKPYKTIIVDTVTELEEMCVPYAEKIYSETSQGKNWFLKTADGKWHPDGGKGKYGSILDLPDGYGYRWLREAFFRMIDAAKMCAPQVIFVGHVKDVILEKTGGNVSTIDLDLTGKIKKMMASRVDTIGYMYRKGNQNIISFKTNDEVSCGSRAVHLANQELVVSERNKTTGKLTTFWDKIYLPDGTEDIPTPGPEDSIPAPESSDDTTAAAPETQQ